jgi:hypothetical protein
VGVDRARADEELGGHFLGARPLADEARDVQLLRCELVGGLRGPAARSLAGRSELLQGALGDGEGRPWLRILRSYLPLRGGGGTIVV